MTPPWNGLETIPNVHAIFILSRTVIVVYANLLFTQPGKHIIRCKLQSSWHTPICWYEFCGLVAQNDYKGVRRNPGCKNDERIVCNYCNLWVIVVVVICLYPSWLWQISIFYFITKANCILILMYKDFGCRRRRRSGCWAIGVFRRHPLFHIIRLFSSDSYFTIIVGIVWIHCLGIHVTSSSSKQPLPVYNLYKTDAPVYPSRRRKGTKYLDESCSIVKSNLRIFRVNGQFSPLVFTGGRPHLQRHSIYRWIPSTRVVLMFTKTG